VAIRPIRLFGDPVLRTSADPVTSFDKELRHLVRDLTDTMLAEDGAGLAAPQIGVGLRVFSYSVDGRVGHLVNPTIAELSEDSQEEDEGCLSFPGLWFPCVRASRAVVHGFTAAGEPVVLDASDMMARCAQHEIDHLDGVLFLDRLDRATRKRALRAINDAAWMTGTAPRIKVSPHPTYGTGR
jgi:peptide deformylase